MKIPEEKEVIATRVLTKDLKIYLFVFMSFGLLGPLISVFQFFRAPEELHLPSVEILLFPVLFTFSIGQLIALMVGKWVTSPLVEKFKNQHISQGVVLDNQNSIFANFGFNLCVGALIGLSFVEGFICNIPLTEDISGSLTAHLHCKTVVFSAIALFVGIVIGLGIRLIDKVASFEKETNQKMIVQYYSTRQWSFIVMVGVGVVVYVFVLAFYKIFTLG